MRCDAHTFVQMYETVYIDLYRFALCMMRNKQDAEDAVSEAVLKAYENIRLQAVCRRIFLCTGCAWMHLLI